ncbi:MAG TPA: deoxyribodipyrimidine photo-lyase, partial [Caulobacteraceae bacterium]|nr:deoxyribodipyrimidine photo-lyase [Caulobacteraceae bacterium]
MSTPVIVWFRKDLRLADNPALAAAAASGAPVIPLFILGDGDGVRAPGGASRWWLHGSLAALDRSLAALGSRLVLRRGRPAEILPALAAETGARRLHWNRLYDPDAVRRDKALKITLEAMGVTVASFNAGALNEPWKIATGSGAPYRVFTPYWRAARP